MRGEKRTLPIANNTLTKKRFIKAEINSLHTPLGNKGFSSLVAQRSIYGHSLKPPLSTQQVHGTFHILWSGQEGLQNPYNS